MRTRPSVYLAGMRMPLLWAAFVLLLGGGLLGLPAWLRIARLAALVAGLALYFRVGTVRQAPIEVQAPVAGRWLAVNSPADKVPSHGLHAYGQTYAIELARGSRPEFGSGPGFRRPEASRPSASRYWSAPGTGWPPASSWPPAATRATRPSPTCTSSSRTTPASCSPPACRSGWPASRSTARPRPASRATAGRSSPAPPGTRPTAGRPPASTGAYRLQCVSPRR
jgi:hypothetical protein